MTQPVSAVAEKFPVDDLVRSITSLTSQGQVSASSRPQADASKAVASAFEQVLALSNDDRRQSLAAAAEAIAGVKDGGRARKLQVAASDFQEAVSKTAG